MISQKKISSFAWFCEEHFGSEQVYFKENVRYPVWTCRDPMSMILGTDFPWSYNIFYNIYFYLTTTSGRPEPECTLRRVMSSEPIQDEQLTRDCKQTTNN